jgi:cation transport protein ChaC
MLDPFRHHPELRGQIKPAADSFFRDLDLAEVEAHAAKAGMPPDWRTPDDVREAGRRAALAGRLDRDLWVFGYGSLMWDPGMEFTELRRAHSPGFARRFCLWDEGGRGTVAAPGLMLAIDEAEDETGCDGM